MWQFSPEMNFCLAHYSPLRHWIHDGLVTVPTGMISLFPPHRGPRNKSLTASFVFQSRGGESKNVILRLNATESTVTALPTLWWW